MPRPLDVARPMLPNLCDLQPILNEIWHTRTLTNGGPFHRKLEREMQSSRRSLCDGCQQRHNRAAPGTENAEFAHRQRIHHYPGHLRCDRACGVLEWSHPGIRGYRSFNAHHRSGLRRKGHYPQISAILAVHVYGTICNVEALQDLADRHGLRLIYDAAHAFGATFKGRSVAALGDASVFSFHATKLFHTLEGGLIATKRPDDTEAIHYLRNFGIKNEEEVVSIGINGKLNEIQAAIGLLNLPLVKRERSFRARLREKYCEFFRSVPGIRFQSSNPRFATRNSISISSSIPVYLAGHAMMCTKV